MTANETRSENAFAAFGVRPVVNCCGIYTDLGGSVLSPTVWNALEELNGAFVRMTDLLDAAGRMIAGLTGFEAARITPGASAAIALSVAATMTGNRGEHWQQLPDTTGLRSEVVIAASHLASYKYAICTRITGARFVAAGPANRFELASLRKAVGPRTTCIFVPAHLLDGFEGAEQLRDVVAMAHEAGVPVVVDAAYMIYPTLLPSLYADAGADLVCFSAKYFGGPNSGGFVVGRRALVDAVEGLDFTRFESGRYRGFGRAFKMSRYDVAATALALREWMALDHSARWAGYAREIQSIAGDLAALPGVTAAARLFTMSEDLIESPTPNALVIEFEAGRRPDARTAWAQLEGGDPIVATILDGDRLIVAVDTLLDGQERIVGQRLAEALATP